MDGRTKMKYFEFIESPAFWMALLIFGPIVYVWLAN